MFCKKCGASIPDDCEFCSACGSKVVLTEETTTEVCTEAPTEVVADTPVDSFTEAPIDAPVKAKKKGFFVKLACIVLAIAVVFTSVFFVFKDNMMGLVMSVMPAEKQMQYTYSRLAKNLSNDFSEDYALSLEKIDSSYSGEMTLDVEASKELLSSFFADEESIINKASLICSIDAEGTDRYGMDMGIKVKDTVLANFQFFIDMSEQKLVMAVPGIVDGAVELDLTENMSGDSAENFRIIQTLTSSENLKKLLPKKDLVKTILPKLVKAAFATIEDIDRERSEFKAGGVTQKAACLEFDITSEVLAKMAIGALEEVKENEDIKEYVEGLAALIDEHKDILEVEPLDTDNLYNDMIDGVNEIIDELKTVDDDDKELLTVKTWVNGKFDIIALDVEIPGVGTGFFGMATDGKKRGFELSVSDLSDTVFKLSGELELNKDKLEGEFDAFSDNNHVANIKVEDMDALKLRKGLINGTFSLTFGTEIEEEISGNLAVADPAIIFTIESEEKAATIKADFTSEGKSLVDVTLTETISDEGKVQIPTDTTDDVEEWAQGVNQQELLDRLEKIGITEDMLNSLFMGSYEDDYDSSYEDSFGMDEEFLYY